MPRARSALLLLGQRQRLEAKERGKARKVAIVVWVRVGVAAANEGVGATAGPQARQQRAASKRCGICCGQLASHADTVNRIAWSARAL
jgi:hypothetical protein